MGQVILRSLEEANLFVVPLDNRRHWYRYHQLSADLLRSRLKEAQPDRIPVLHERASRGYEREGYIPDAISHTLATSDHQRAAAAADDDDDDDD